MAKEHLHSEEQKPQIAQDLVSSIFTNPSRYIEEFMEQNIDLGQDDALGVATLRTIEQELRLRGLKRDKARPVATFITSGLNSGQYNGLFPIGSNVRINVHKNTNGEKVYARSDATNVGIRLTLYQELLEKELEELRQKSAREESAKDQKPSKRQLRQALEREKEQAKLAMIREKARILVLIQGPLTEKDFNEGLEKFKARAPQGQDIYSKVMSQKQDYFDPSGSLLHRQDVKTILAQGLDAQDWRLFLPKVRAGVIETTEILDTLAYRLAGQIVDEASSLLTETKNPQEYLHAAVKRGISPFVVYFTHILKGERVIVEEDIPPPLPTTNYHPHTMEVMSRWHLRYDPEVLIGELEQIKNIDPDLAVALGNSVFRDGATQLFGGLYTQGSISLEGKDLKKAELDSVLSEVLLPDSLLRKAIFSDLLSEVFPMQHYFAMAGDRPKYEVAGIAIYNLCGIFSEQEMEQLMLPLQNDPSKAFNQINDIKNQIGQLQAQKASIRGGDRLSQQKRNEIDKQIQMSAKELAKAISESKIPITIAGNIKAALRSRVPLKEPDPKAYGWTNKKDPKPEKFADAVSRFESLMYACPEGWYRKIPRGLIDNISTDHTRAIINRTILA